MMAGKNVVKPYREISTENWKMKLESSQLWLRQRELHRSRFV